VLKTHIHLLSFFVAFNNMPKVALKKFLPERNPSLTTDHHIPLFEKQSYGKFPTFHSTGVGKRFLRKIIYNLPDRQY
jgi:hypothetical protein